MKTYDELIEAVENCFCLNGRACDDCPYYDSCDTESANPWRDDLIYYLHIMHDLAKDARWIPVSERLPEDDEIMAVRCETKKGTVTWNRAYWDGEFWHGSGSMASVTHWRRISTEVGKWDRH